MKFGVLFVFIFLVFDFALADSKVATQTSGESCSKVAMKWIVGKKFETKKYELCNRGTKKISQLCVKNKNCQAKKLAGPQKPLARYQGVGSPAHQRCHIVGGLPRIVKFKESSKDSKWQDGSFCFFDDGSLISL